MQIRLHGSMRSVTCMCGIRKAPMWMKAWDAV